jgi:tRNA pseudouridine38-40 synthase
MRHIKLTLAYDGTNYSGWQIQPNAISIQELVQKAVREMTGEENNVVAAGRTDAGVHACGQVASFRTERDIPLDGFKKGLGTILPRDIRVLDASEVNEDFHPIRDSKLKHYRYMISEGEFEHPLSLHRSWTVGRSLDIDLMQEAASYLIGEHDFTSFCASDACEGSRVREIESIKVNSLSPWGEGRGEGENDLSTPPHPSLLPKGEKEIIINITGSGFLKNMVRNIVGTLVDVGLEKISPEEFKKILEAKDRKKAGICAPACGLYLVVVDY